MEIVTQFVKYLKTQKANNGIYILGAQGEDVETLTPEWIEKHENAQRISQIFNLISQKYAAGKSLKKAKAFDCSGLFVYFGLFEKLIPYDMTADMLYKICVPIKPNELQEGDEVFQVDNNEKMHHIGYMSSKNMVIEAKGRAYGVVETEFSTKLWSHYGRFCFFCDFPITKILSYDKTRAVMTGKEVALVQATLNLKGCSCGNVDGQYGPKTAEAVKRFQEKYKVGVLDSNLGKVNKKTALALGLRWKE